MKKRALSLLLALVMVFGLLPVTARAETCINDLAAEIATPDTIEDQSVLQNGFWASRTLQVGDTATLDILDWNGEIPINAVWTSDSPAVEITYQQIDLCKIKVVDYPGDSPVIIQCKYWYRDYLGFIGGEEQWLILSDIWYYKIYVEGQKVRVYLDPDGGTVSRSYLDLTYGGTYSGLPTPTYPGTDYGFKGWYRGNSRITSSSTVSVNYDHTLYAHWCKEHNYTLYTKTDPSCTSTGSKRFDCIYCDEYYRETIPALGHDWSGTECTRCDATRLTPFDDVQQGGFYEEAVAWAVENGITTGASATTFNPNGDCLRAQVVTFLHRAAGNPEPTSTKNPFTDVKASDFFYKPVLWAVEKGITNGTSATTFGSYDVCNRAAVVTFLWRTAGSPEPKTTSNPFVDVKSTDFFYKPVLWAVENGITNGVDATHFGPTAACNRAQVVTFLYRAKELLKADPNTRYTFELTSNDSNEQIGFIDCDASSFTAGEEVTFYAEPNYGYLVELEVSPANADLELEYIGLGYYTMVMPAHDVSINARFYPAEGDYHYISGSVSRCRVGAVCIDDEDGNLVAKPGEHVYLYIYPNDGYPYVSFGIYVDDEVYDNWEYLGMIEDDPDRGTYHIVEFVMPDADVEISAVCSATSSGNASESLDPMALPGIIPSTIPKSTTADIR